MDEFEAFSVKFASRKRVRPEPQPACALFVAPHPPAKDRSPILSLPTPVPAARSPCSTVTKTPPTTLQTGSPSLLSQQCVCGTAVADSAATYCPLCHAHPYCSYKCRIADIVDHSRHCTSSKKARVIDTRPPHTYAIVGSMDEDARIRFLRRKPPGQRSPDTSPQKATAQSSQRFDATTLVPHVERAAALDCSFYFRHLPNPMELPTYYRVITNPTSLDAIVRKCRARRYRNLGEFVADCMQIVENSRTFNGEGTHITNDAKATVRAILEPVTQKQCALCSRAAVAVCSVCHFGRCNTCPVCTSCTVRYQKLQNVARTETPVTEPDADSLAHLIYSIPVELTGHFVQMLANSHMFGCHDLTELAPGQSSVTFEIAPDMIPELFRRLLPLVT